MANHKSALKRVRQSAKRREENRYKLSTMRSMIKQLRTLEDKGAAQTLLNDTKAYLDRLACKGIIHANKAANYKSQLEKHVGAIE